jgi:hypothetical protein
MQKYPCIQTHTITRDNDRSKNRAKGEEEKEGGIVQVISG